MFAVSLALLADAFPGAKERAGALAAYGATIGASFAIGPLVGGALTSGLDWQWIFLVNIPLGIACICDHPRARARVARSARPPASTGPGQVTLSAGLFLLVLALLRGNEEGWGSTPIVAELAGAAVAARSRSSSIERRVAEPMLPLGLFRNPIVHRRAGRGVRDLGVVLRDLPLRHALPAAGAGAVRDRGRPRLPARRRS